MTNCGKELLLPSALCMFVSAHGEDKNTGVEERAEKHSDCLKRVSNHLEFFYRETVGEKASTLMYRD